MEEIKGIGGIEGIEGIEVIEALGYLPARIILLFLASNSGR